MEKPDLAQWLILTILVYSFNVLLKSFLYVLINCNLAGSTQGHAKVPRGECHGMHLGLSFPTSRKVDECVYYGIHTLSEGLYSAYQEHAHGFLPKRAKYHWSIMWWHSDDIRVFWMMIFASVLKGYKMKNTQEGGDPKFQFHRVKIHT